MTQVLDRRRIATAAAAAERAFVDAHPRCLAAVEAGRRAMPRGVAMTWFGTIYGHPPLVAVEGSGARFRCADGRSFLDMGLAIVSAFAGYGHPAIVQAIERQARRGTQFALPGPDDGRLAEALAERWGLPYWQFTLSATAANTEAIRTARAMTGRPDILVFDGKYHGYHDETLLVRDGDRYVPEYLGLAPLAGRATRVVPFNDLDAVAGALADRQVAAVLAEPALLNVRTVLPEPGFHDGLRRLAEEAGTLLIVDETYGLTMAYGGLTSAWDLRPDIVTMGKSLAGGVPLGAWGMTERVASFLEAPGGSAAGYGGEQFVGRPIGEVGTGATLAANALSMAAGLAMVEEVLTPETYERTARLGDRLAGGLRAVVERLGVGWSVVHVANRAGLWWAPVLPRTAADVIRDEDEELSDAIRLLLLERGIFDAGGWAHPAVGAAHGERDVDEYLAELGAVLGEVLGELEG